MESISDFKLPANIKLKHEKANLPKLFSYLVSDCYAEWKKVKGAPEKPAFSFRQMFPELANKLAMLESGTKLYLSHTDNNEEGSMGLFLLTAISAMYIVGKKQKLQLMKEAMKSLKKLDKVWLDGFFTVGVLTFGTSSAPVCVISFANCIFCFPLLTLFFHNLQDVQRLCMYLHVLKNQKSFLNSVIKSPDRYTTESTFECLLVLCLVSFSSLVFQAFTENPVSAFTTTEEKLQPLYENLYFYTDKQFEKVGVGEQRSNEMFFTTFKHTAFASAIAFTETVSNQPYFRDLAESHLTSAAAVAYENQDRITALEAQNVELEKRITRSEKWNDWITFYIDEPVDGKGSLQDFIQQQMTAQKDAMEEEKKTAPTSKLTKSTTVHKDSTVELPVPNPEDVPPFAGGSNVVNLQDTSEEEPELLPRPPPHPRTRNSTKSNEKVRGVNVFIDEEAEEVDSKGRKKQKTGTKGKQGDDDDDNDEPYQGNDDDDDDDPNKSDDDDDDEEEFQE